MLDEKREKYLKAIGRRLSVAEGAFHVLGISMGGIFAVNFVLTAYMLDVLNTNKFIIGLVVSLGAIIGLLQPFVPPILKLFKTRKTPVLIASFGGRSLFIASVLAGIYAPDEIKISVFIIGVFIAACVSSLGVGWNTWMADLVPENIRGRFFSTRDSFANIANMAGFLLAGFILNSLTADTRFLVIYLIAFVAVFIGNVFMFLQYEPASTEDRSVNLVENYKGVLKDKNFALFLFTVFYFFFGAFFGGSFQNVYFIEYLEIPYSTLSILTAIMAFINILAVFFWGKLIDIIGNKIVTKISTFFLVFVPVLWIITPKSNYMPFFLITSFINSFFASGMFFSIYLSALQISPQKNRSVYIAIFAATQSVALLLGPALGGWLIDFYAKNPIPILSSVILHPTMLVFALEAISRFALLFFFPDYRIPDGKTDTGLKEFFRFDSIPTLARVFLSSFMPLFSSREKMAINIGTASNPLATASLIKLLNDSDSDVRLQAVWGLAKIGNEKSMEALLDAYEDSDILEQREIVRALRSFTHYKAKNILIENLSSDDSVLKAESIRALINTEECRAEEKVRDILINTKDNRLFISALEYFAAFAILDNTKDILKRYQTLSEKRQRRALYLLSVMFCVRPRYYYFTALDTDADRQAYILKTLKTFYEKAMKEINDTKVLESVKQKIKQIKGKTSTGEAVLLNEEYPLIKEILDLTINMPNANVDEAINFFCSKQKTSDEEIIFSLLLLLRYTSERMIHSRPSLAFTPR